MREALEKEHSQETSVPNSRTRTVLWMQTFLSAPWHGMMERKRESSVDSSGERVKYTQMKMFSHFSSFLYIASSFLTKGFLESGCITLCIIPQLVRVFVCKPGFFLLKKRLYFVCFQSCTAAFSPFNLFGLVRIFHLSNRLVDRGFSFSCSGTVAYFTVNLIESILCATTHSSQLG